MYNPLQVVLQQSRLMRHPSRLPRSCSVGCAADVAGSAAQGTHRIVASYGAGPKADLAAGGAETHIDQSIFTIIAADTTDGLGVRPPTEQRRRTLVCTIRTGCLGVLSWLSMRLRIDATFYVHHGALSASAARQLQW